MPKDKTGKNNPFYGKHHTEENKKKMGAAVLDYNGDKNPFYGRKHKRETIDGMKKKLSEKFSGDKNPFFGKTHSAEAIEKIKSKNKEFLEKNKEIILEKRLKRLNLTREKLEKFFFEYCSTHKNANDIQEELSVDKRVFFKYVEQLGIATSEEIKKIKIKKQLSNSLSSPEAKFYAEFCKKYGPENVIWNYKISRYFFDFYICNCLLVEYDGYYWHTIKKSKNDKKKDELAKNFGIKLYRIKEDEKRKSDIDFEISKIDEVLNEIRVSRNNQ